MTATTSSGTAPGRERKVAGGAKAPFGGKRRGTVVPLRRGAFVRAILGSGLSADAT